MLLDRLIDRIVRTEGRGVLATLVRLTGDLDTAEEALQLIDVEYEELPAVFDPIAAMRPEAPLLHDDVASYAGAPLAVLARGSRRGSVRARSRSLYGRLQR